LNIYSALLDQKCVVGVGNIYANESLFVARVKPTRKARLLTKEEYNKLYKAIRKILRFAVKKRGTSIDKYMDALGDYGQFSKYLKVYGKSGVKCSRQGCSGKVKRLKINTRSAFYCNWCQK
jgi:formamidopyrimidine-DNA glycosylase